jgi:histidine ammonia-lyase
MTEKEIVKLDGYNLSIEDVVYIGVGDKKVELDSAALERCAASRKFLEEEVAKKRIIYGVNTSFGPMCGKIIHDDEIETLQVNLIRSHAAGLGDPLKPYIAIAVLAV